MCRKRATKIIIACDGTWQSASTGDDGIPTDVAALCGALSTHKFSRRSRKKHNQIVFYQSGVGSGLSTSFETIIDGAFGEGLEQNAREAYLFLAENYTQGDEIYLFGFSRGAYTARTIAAFIGTIGVLSAAGAIHFKDLYNMYTSTKGPRAWQESLRMYMVENRLDETAWRTPPDKVIIKIVGCWETVGALGVPSNWLAEFFHTNDKYQFLNMQVPPRVEYSFHALALDEHRASFYPAIWWLDPKAQRIHDANGNVIKPKLAQCWFPGHHNDVGGNEPNRKIANLALAWIVDECRKTGHLEFDQNYLKSILAPTRNQVVTSWLDGAKDPFYAGFLPSRFWSFLGSRVRQPANESFQDGIRPATKSSRTFEFIHYSVREKADEIGKQRYENEDCEECATFMFKGGAPSRALIGYKFDNGAWVKDLPDCERMEIPEFPPPDVEDEASMQAYLSSNWLRQQH
ncbi:hypothetical protein BJ878DRAFT_516946 [Calycina marina]|uniref:T6SS Phospholipase effector Tle1-like catalytic domain-containing protein n=1 Tax=Calycina marina TaxID=1763456 RepID=A0A9P8CEC0_9HELO|nr:hypothetical protein BJ878DRAFT_516946 [Calycina marina]